MKEKVINKTKELTAFSLSSILAGFSISIGATIFLYVTSANPSDMWLKALGALFFNLGLLTIIFFGLKLFTGMNADIIDTHYRGWYKLIICFIFNAVGIWLGALIMFKTSIGSAIMTRATEITITKLNSNLAYTFAGSIMCGVLITLAVFGYRKFKDTNPVAGILAVIFPIFVFVMIGVDHSVANQMYFALACLNGYGFPAEIILHTFIVMLGNILGGIFFPAVLKIKQYLEKKKEPTVEDIEADKVEKTEDAE